MSQNISYYSLTYLYVYLTISDINSTRNINQLLQEKFFPHTITDWNSLPNELIESTTLEDFSYYLKSLWLYITNYWMDQTFG